VDEDDPGRTGSAPVEEVDPIAAVGDDDVAGRVEARVHEARMAAMPKRRRGSRHSVRPRGHARFERLVEGAIDEIPDRFRAALAEVAIVIDDEPTDDQLAAHDMEPVDTLYGLYEGVPLTEYASDWVSVPNRITLFRLPLEEDFPDPDDLADEVRITILHELGHHLGIDDHRLGELGID
jgi:predicted Zn-dependent protease with MMP-like domain